MPRWDIRATRDGLERRYGSAQLFASRNAIRAATVRMDHAAYHFRELRRLLRQHLDDKLVDRDLYEVAMPVGEEWDTLQEGLLEVEAHMIACAQSIHAVPDALAHIAYFAAGLNLVAKPIPEDRVSLKVLVRSGLLGAVGWGQVEQALSGLVCEPAFTALDAVVNYAKHRGLPDPSLQLEPEDHPAPYAMQFASFSYGGAVQPKVEVERLLAPAYSAVSCGAVEVGNAINASLA